MERDTEQTIVVFRKRKNEIGGILALFPAVDWDGYGKFCASYERIGQHSGADYNHCIARTVPATPAEYADLKAELGSMGYNLAIRIRYTRPRGRGGKMTCPTCDGTGVIVSYDSVPYGMGNTLMPTDEYCTACLMRDDARGGSVCNRCGKPRTWHEDGEYFTPCAHCGATDPYMEAAQ